MAAPVVQSSNTTAYANANPTMTKPTGLAVGDLLVAYIHSIGGSTASITAPAGWTTQQAYTAVPSRAFSLFTKVADSADVAAGTYAFTANTSNLNGGIIMRVDGYGNITTSELDSVNSTSTPTFTGASTPDIAETLVLMSIACNDTNGQATISGYATTPSMTWTEIQEIGIDTGATLDPSMAVARAVTANTTQITSYSATLSQSKDSVRGTLLLIRPITNATGTNATFQVLPSFFAPTASVGTDGTNALLSVSPTINAQSGTAPSPTQWNNEPANTTTWSNEQQS